MTKGNGDACCSWRVFVHGVPGTQSRSFPPRIYSHRIFKNSKLPMKASLPRSLAFPTPPHPLPPLSCPDVLLKTISSAFVASLHDASITVVLLARASSSGSGSGSRLRLTAHAQSSGSELRLTAQSSQLGLRAQARDPGSELTARAHLRVTLVGSLSEVMTNEAETAAQKKATGTAMRSASPISAPTVRSPTCEGRTLTGLAW